MSAFEDLMAFQRETEALAQVAGRLGWDQETMMPAGAVAQRGEEHAAMERVLHGRRSDPRVGDWLAAAEAPDDAGAANLALIRRAHDRATKVPGDLAAALARATSLAHVRWIEARAAEDFGHFAVHLEEVLALRRQEAAALAGDGAPYDALLADYEPGTTAAEVAALFDRMRPRLVALRERVLGSDVTAPVLDRAFDDAAQGVLVAELAQVFGYDMTRGRIDRAVHPFSSGSGDDVRITTRTSPRDPFNAIYSTIHEVGHAAYEQGVDPAHRLTPVGGGVSMGVHESQSRIYENQLGRSRAFTGWLLGRMQAHFGDIGVADADAFHAAVNRVDPGFIRTEADEVHYNLHILMRFDLERALLSGDLAVPDLPGAWDDRFEADFGRRPPKPSDGCLQDVHWSEGLFGYFPTYTLGNVYAGCLNQAMRADLPDLDDALAAGDASPATDWLRERVQRHGGLRSPRETVARATGAEPGEAPLLDYLDVKFGAIYGV